MAGDTKRQEWLTLFHTKEEADAALAEFENVITDEKLFGRFSGSRGPEKGNL